MFVLDVTFGFRGVIDCSDGVTAFEVSVVSVLLLLLLSVRAPIPDPLPPNAVAVVGTNIEVLLKENGLMPTTTMTIELWFTAESAPT